MWVKLVFLTKGSTSIRYQNVENLCVCVCIVTSTSKTSSHYTKASSRRIPDINVKDEWVKVFRRKYRAKSSFWLLWIDKNSYIRCVHSLSHTHTNIQIKNKTTSNHKEHKLENSKTKNLCSSKDLIKVVKWLTSEYTENICNICISQIPCIQNI